METMQAEASRIIQATTLPVPIRERSVGVEPDLYQEFPPCNMHHNGCLTVALLVWQWALENGYTVIEIIKSPTHKHRFDVIDLVKKKYIRPKRPRSSGTHSLLGRQRFAHAQTGSYQDRMHNYVPVNTSFSANGRRKEIVL